MFHTDTGEGRPLVLLHGWGFDHGSWQPIIDLLAAQYRVIVPDLRGHGSSQTPSEPYEFAALSDDVNQLVESLDLSEPPVVVGHSFGGMVAMQFAVDHPASLGALVVVDADLNPPGAFRFLMSANAWISALLMRLSVRVLGESGTLGLIPPLLALAAYSGSWRRAHRAVLAESSRTFKTVNTVEGLVETLVAYANRPDLTRDLATAAPAALVVRGSRDLIVSQGRIDALTRAIPDARLEIVPGAGHMTVIEQPQVVAGLVGAFLETRW